MSTVDESLVLIFTLTSQVIKLLMLMCRLCHCTEELISFYQNSIESLCYAQDFARFGFYYLILNLISSASLRQQDLIILSIEDMPVMFQLYIYYSLYIWFWCLSRMNDSTTLCFEMVQWYQCTISLRQQVILFEGTLKSYPLL